MPTSISRIESNILLVRGEKVMLDADLALLYGVPTKALNQAVKRNAQRFPSDFMFRLTREEKQDVVTNCDRFANLKAELICCQQSTTVSRMPRGRS